MHLIGWLDPQLCLVLCLWCAGSKGGIAVGVVLLLSLLGQQIAARRGGKDGAQPSS